MIETLQVSATSLRLAWAYQPPAPPANDDDGWIQGFADKIGLVVVDKKGISEFDWRTGKRRMTFPVQTLFGLDSCVANEKLLVCGDREGDDTHIYGWGPQNE